jgi:hypothetical protein
MFKCFLRNCIITIKKNKFLPKQILSQHLNEKRVYVGSGEEKDLRDKYSVSLDKK